MKNSILILLFFFGCISPVFAQQNSDSKIQDMEIKIERLEGFQSNTKGALDNKFNELKRKDKKQFDDFSREIHGQISWIKPTLYGALGINAVYLFSLFFWARNYVRKKIKEKFDRIITENEGDILELIDRQNEEKQILKRKKILVLSAKGGDDSFFKLFFRENGFNNVDNISFKKVDSYQDFGQFDLIFANNERNDLEFELIDEYFENSNEQMVLFYFNTTGEKYINANVSDRLNFANGRNQIYGNLINLLKYQKILRRIAL